MVFKLDKPLVSIIMSNYNYDQFISEAIESVLNQTYRNFEIIIVDDGSTDNSLKTIQEYRRNYPKIIKTIEQKNSGQAVAFNRAFELASGKIIAFLDADDYWYSHKLETIIKYHQKYPAVQHNLSINNEEKITILEDKVQKQKNIWEKYAYAGPIPTSGLSFTKESLAFVFPIQDNGYKVCADWYLKGMYLNEYDIFSLNESLGCYRAHGANNWYSKDVKYEQYGEFILNQANLYRKQKGKPLINVKANDYFKVHFKEFMFSTLKLDKKYQYIIFGTGQLGKYFYEKLKNAYTIIGFTNSMTNKCFEVEDLICRPLKEVIENLDSNKKILIASDRLGEIEYLLKQLGVAEEQIDSPKL